MASSTEHLRLQALPLERKLKTLLNADLKQICKEYGLMVSGTKALLQGRIIEHISSAVERGNAQLLNELYDSINAFGTPLPAPSRHHLPNPSRPSQSPLPNNEAYRIMSNGYNRGSVGAHLPHHGGLSSGSRVNFKKSPFYSLEESLTNVVELPVLSNSKHIANTSFTISPINVDKLRNDKSLRIMLYCAGDPGNIPYPVDIAFPDKIELRINAEPYNGTLKGIKKKPGTTRPADITDLTRKLNSYTNNVQITISATDRVHNPSPSKFLMVVYLVRKHSVEELVEKIKRGHQISKQTVINEMVSKARDPDIVTTSTVMSLKCPLSTMRMTLPCRSTICGHNQCFDATSFLQVQEQAPQWSCPTCNKSVGFEALAIDQYVLDILSRVPKSVDQVTIEPDGNWKKEGQAEEFRVPTSTAKRKLPADFDDDLIEIMPHTNGFGGRTSTPQSFAHTPVPVSRDVSRATSGAPRSSAKKDATPVIDLTLDDDDDDDDQPPRRPGPIKRPSTSSNSFVGHSAYTPQPHSAPARPYAFSLPFSHQPTPTPPPMPSFGQHGYGSWN